MFQLSVIGLGLRTLALGMLVVFSALAIIWLVVAVIGSVFKRRQNAETKPAPVPPEPIVSTPAAPASSDDSALIAVIAAAIAEYEQVPVGSFRVVHYKKR